MEAMLTAAVMFATVAATVSAFLYLPAQAIVETLSPLRARTRAAIWLCALVLPLLAGLVGTGLGLHGALAVRYGSPHLTSNRPHLCARWLLAAPDAQWRISLAGLVCLGLGGGAVARLVLGGVRSALAGSRLRGALAPGAQALIVDDDSLLLVTVGLLKPVVVMTSGARAALSADELRAALAHEASHVSHRDNLLDLVGSLCVMPIVFMPTAHLFFRHWREEVERACDDAGAQATSGQTTASALVRLATAAEAASRHRLLIGVPAGQRHARADLKRRVGRLLADGPAEGLQWQAAGAPTVVVIVLGVLTAAGALALVIVATARQVDDTLYCLAETLLRLLGGQ